MRHFCFIVLVATTGIVLTACSPQVRTVKLDDDVNLRRPHGYQLAQQMPVLMGGLGDTAFFVSFSGGGTRAAALAAGAARALEKSTSRFDGTANTQGEATLLDEVDIVSSVSGGSVTAAAIALHGKTGLDLLDKNFLYENIILEAIGDALNPVMLGKLMTPSATRIDVMISIFRERLFSAPGGRPYTYADLLAKPGKHPFLIMNATDMSSASQFPLTQDWFDLLCADLSRFTLAEGVAASSAFPVLMTPVTLKNYSSDGCAAQDKADAALKTQGRPVGPYGYSWPLAVTNALNSKTYVNPTRHRRAVIQNQYLKPNAGHKKFVHLLDGGIADNVGLLEPLQLLQSGDSNAVIPQQILDGKLSKVVFLVVNARSEDFGKLDEENAPPSMLKMLGASINGGIDGATFGSLQRLEAYMNDVITTVFQESIDSARDEKNFVEVARLTAKRDALLAKLQTYTIPVDFDYIANAPCRNYLKGISTTWSLEKSEVDALKTVGEAMVYRAPDFGKLIHDGLVVPGKAVGEAWASEKPETLLDDACASIGAKD